MYIGAGIVRRFSILIVLLQLCIQPLWAVPANHGADKSFLRQHSTPYFSPEIDSGLNLNEISLLELLNSVGVQSDSEAKALYMSALEQGLITPAELEVFDKLANLNGITLHSSLPDVTQNRDLKRFLGKWTQTACLSSVATILVCAGLSATALIAFVAYFFTKKETSLSSLPCETFQVSIEVNLRQCPNKPQYRVTIFDSNLNLSTIVCLANAQSSSQSDYAFKLASVVQARGKVRVCGTLSPFIDTQKPQSFTIQSFKE